MRCGLLNVAGWAGCLLGLYDDGVKAKSVVRVLVIIGGGGGRWKRLKTALVWCESLNVSVLASRMCLILRCPVCKYRGTYVYVEGWGRLRGLRRGLSLRRGHDDDDLEQPHASKTCHRHLHHHRHRHRI